MDIASFSRDPLPRAATRAIDAHVASKSIQTLMGIVTGVVADAHLHDQELALLSTWLREHEEATRGWPGDAIHAHVRQVLADGVVTELERANLLAALTDMANCDFAATGSAQAEPMQLPIDDSAVVEMQGAVLVHTGEFAYGTRARCERLSSEMGAVPVDSVTSKTDILVIGTRVSRAWLNESYGRKILRAMELRKVGHRIRIISERWWFEHARRAGKVT